MASTYEELTEAQTDAKSPIDEQLVQGNEATDTGGIRHNFINHEDRITDLENNADVSDFADLFDDCVIPANHPQHGAGNTGLTNSAATNPHGKDFATVRYQHGVKYYYIHGIRKTGKTIDRSSEFTEISDPLQEWQVFGNWTEDEMVVRMYSRHDNGMVKNVANESGTELRLNEEDTSIFSVNGVYDSIGLLLNTESRSASVPAYVDGSLVVTLDTARPHASFGESIPNDVLMSDSNLKGLGWDLHETVFINSDSSPLSITGFVCVGDGVAHGSVIGGNVLVNKTSTAISETASVTAPTTTGTYGGLAVLYTDRTSSGALTWAVNEMEDVTTVTDSVISGGASTTVDVPTGEGSNFAAGDMIWVKDGVTTQEYARVTGVATDTLTVSAAFTNGFSSGVALERVARTWLNSSVSTYDDTWEANNQRLVNRFYFRCFGHEHGGANTWGQLNGAQNDVHYTLRDYGTNLTLGGGATCDTQQGNAGSNAFQTFDGFRSTGQMGGFFTFTGTGCAVTAYNSSSLASGASFDIYYQGILIGSLDDTADDGVRRHNIISGLPMGTHTIYIYQPGGSTEEQYLMQFDVFGPDLPAVVKPGDGSRTQYEGNILAYRNLMADFDFSTPDRQGVVVSGFGVEIGSMGVKYLPDVQRLWEFDNGSGDRSDSWDSSLSGADSETYFGGAHVKSDHTNATASIWFFGTGFEFIYTESSSRGEGVITIDGTTLTAANFGSATFYESLSVTGGFDDSTGTLDMYDSSGDQNCRFGVTGLSASPEWHQFKITIGNTKNASSSGFECQLVGFGVIGGEPGFTRGVALGRMGHAGDVLDMRKLSPVPTLYNQYVYPVERYVSQSFSGTVTRYHSVSGQGLDLYSDGRYWEIETNLTMSQSSSSQFFMANYGINGELVRDDWDTVTRGSDTFKVDTEFRTYKYTETVYLDEGDHVIKLFVYPKSGGVVFFVEGQTNMIAKPLPKDWRPR